MGKVLGAWGLVFVCLTGCSGDDGTPTDAGGDADATATDGPVPNDTGPNDTGPNDGTTQDVQDASATVARASRSSTIALSNDGSLVAMVNPQDNSVTIFATSNAKRIGAPITAGSEPSSVVFAPDGTLYVANRADGTISKITSPGASPTITTSADLGSEPTGIALSPSGALLFVAEWAQSQVSVLNTSTMSVVKALAVDRPRALAVTNAGSKDSDEFLIVPEFYGRPTGTEATDSSRTSTVHIFKLDSAFTEQTPLAFAPRAITPPAGSNVPSNATFAAYTSPNQVFSVNMQGTRAYFTSISASPSGPPNFASNVYPVVWVADVGTASSEVTDPKVGTFNLMEEIFNQVPTSPLMMGDIVDMDFEDQTTAYVLSRASNAVQRVKFDSTAGHVLGTSVKQIDLDGMCLVPTGIVVAPAASRAYVNCWNSFNLQVIDLSQQTAIAPTSDQQSITTLPTGTALDQNNGRKFFFTGRGRWSAQSDGTHGLAGAGWSACASCHPDGYSDNVTWSFPAGPRQSTSLDGTFSHHSGSAGKMRVLNWTAIFDELDDFERNVRGVAGGLGAFTTGTCGTSETQTSVPNDGLGAPAATGATCSSLTSFQSIANWLTTLRPPRALAASSSALADGADTFSLNKAGCAKCHGGAGFTLSRLFWTPSSTSNTQLQITPFSVQGSWDPTWTFYDNTSNPKLVQFQPFEANLSSAVSPNQVGCVIRYVNTFGAAPLEKKQDSTLAQGQGGYNIPSLYGLALGAPYLHDGAATSLNDLLTSSAFSAHLQAGNSGLFSFGQTTNTVDNLVAYLLSLDENATETLNPVDSSSRAFDGCPTSFP